MERMGCGLVVLVGLVTFFVACSGGDDDGASSSDGPMEPEMVDVSDDGFYAVPDPLPAGEHGDLLRYQLVTNPPGGVTWYRVMYLSETVAGEPTVVTGVVTVPDGDPPVGGWPLVSHAHGSTGLDDPCAPSVSLDGDRLYAPELALLGASAATHGVVVASTDYEGLGGPGRHPFLVGTSEGRGVLDIALAARQIPGVEVGDRTAIAGYSQGGHAALWANQIAADWTPSLDIVGTMAGAPASELLTSTEGLPAEVRDQFEVALVAGLAAAYPEADPQEILTPAGLDLARRYERECPPVQGLDPQTPLLQSRPAATEPWSTLLEENTPGQVAGPTPILIIHSAEDANVPIAASAALLDRMCAVGQVVERRVLPTGDHVGAAIPAYQQGSDWFDSLWNGARPATSCP
ncbi:MAG TPA: lipase family protein [Acidimicrobiales bacterium]|jgi:hypothetical protein